MCCNEEGQLRWEGDLCRMDRRVNGLEVHARYRRETVETILLPLLRRWTALQRERNRRILVLLAAPPAAGKSTLVEFLQALSQETDGVTPLQAIGMDGFHYPQDYLKTHTILRDGAEVPLVSIKGAPPTFDLAGLTARLRRLKEEDACPWPLYDRTLHNPVEGRITVTRSIVLLEGNYLLLEEPGWRELRDLADDTLRILAESRLLRERLVARKLRTGVSRAEAEAFVDRSDLANARLCEQMGPANTTLRLTEEGHYVRAEEDG